MNMHSIGYQHYQFVSALTINVKKLRKEDKINEAQYLDAMAVLSNVNFNNQSNSLLNSILDGSFYYYDRY